MKFTCQQAELVKALNIVSKAVTNRSTIPVLKGILLQAFPDGRLTISSSDLDISIQDTIPVEVAEPGSVIVMARMFSDIVRRMPGIEIEFEADAEHHVSLTSMTVHFDIVGLSPDEFPVMNQIDENTESIDFDTETLREMIDKTSFAASIDESRGIITGVLMELSDNGISMVAIDGYRMAITRRTMPTSGAHSFVVPARILNEISKILADISQENERGTLFLGAKKAVFLFGSVQAELKLLEGKFVAYQSILPKESAITMSIDRKQLMDSIERASLFAKAGRNNLVRFALKDKVLTVSSDSEEGKATEDILVSKEGGDLTIGFNAHYLLDVLKSIDDEQVVMKFNTAIDPCLVEPVEGNDFEYLILPVRIN